MKKVFNAQNLLVLTAFTVGYYVGKGWEINFVVKKVGK